MQKSKTISLTLIIFATITVPFLIAQNGYGRSASPAYQVDDEYIAHLPVVLRNDADPIPPTPTPRPTVTPPEGMILVDHNSVALFEDIPDAYLAAARDIHMVFMDRSVGVNIDEGLNCLTYSSWGSSPSSCRRDYYDADWNWKTYTESDHSSGGVPSTILFEPDPVKYDRRNWTFQYQAGDWEQLTENFVAVQFPAYVNGNDALGYQFSYLNISEGSSIDGEWVGGTYTPGFFDEAPGNPNRWDISDIEALEAQYPGKTIIYWTTSLARNIGTLDGENFNDQMRQYAIANEKVLFDVADILAHDPAGQLCFDFTRWRLLLQYKYL